MNIDTLNAHGGFGSTRSHARLRVGERNQSRARSHCVSRSGPSREGGCEACLAPPSRGLKFTPQPPTRNRQSASAGTRVATALPLSSGRTRLALLSQRACPAGGTSPTRALRVSNRRRNRGAAAAVAGVSVHEGAVSLPTRGRGGSRVSPPRRNHFFSDLRSDEITR